MDKSWINKSRLSKEYRDGLKDFINFAKRNSPYPNLILCPCVRCSNCDLRTCDVVETHVICNGFLPGYTNWFCHGESARSVSNGPVVREDESLFTSNQSAVDEMHSLVRDGMRFHNFQVHTNNPINQVCDEPAETFVHDGGVGDEMFGEETNKEFEAFDKLLKDAKTPLYRDCTQFTKFSFIVRLFQIKCLNGWSAKSFNLLLELLNEAFPEIQIPKSSHAIKKFLKHFNLGYEKIAACPYDCMLFRGDKKVLEDCEVCGTSKWIQTPNEDDQTNEPVTTTRRKKFAKILRYFPLIPRLQRLFMSSKTSSDMRWHAEGRKNDGILRHPADSASWKNFDERYPDFAEDPRNVRLGLASDGFNPFRQMSSTYSIWPVVLIPYNLPPWLCMKQSSFILSMIIPGPKSPGNDIDVYLQPLIDELSQLWEGVTTYDATSKESFRLRVALTWTINDFPAYASLSGYSTKGRYACPCCAEQTDSKWLYKGKKFCYMGHRRWLCDTHIFRAETSTFDGTDEWRHAPRALSGSDVLRRLEGHQFTLSKDPAVIKASKKRAREEQHENTDLCDADECNNHVDSGSWKKKSIFFQLPYWEYTLLRHNIDVMHLGKNIGENIIGTVMGDDRRTKDNLKSRLDLVELGIRHELHPEELPNGRVRLPPAIYSMSKMELEIFCNVLQQLKVPDGYSSNIARCVNYKEKKLQGPKSHDYHILMQDILPVALRSSMCEPVTSVLKDICSIYKGLCSRVLRVEDIDKLEQRAALTLCQMERIFPPSFFTIMVHLVIHLADEARLGRPVHYRWMYPIERYPYRLKGYVKNKAYPEGSIAEGYLSEECSNFCSRYLHGVETCFNRPRRNPDTSNLKGAKYLFQTDGTTFGKIDAFELDDLTWEQAHRYVLDHSASCEPYRVEFIRVMKRRHRPKTLKPRELHKLMNEKFHKWFETHVSSLGDDEATSEIKILAKGPHKMVKRYNGYIFNGFRFRTQDRERNLKSQNSGIVVTSKTRSYASKNDTNPVDGDVDYYGVLTDIIDLDYYGHFRVVLFRGDWAGINNMKVDKLGFTIVNFAHLIHTGTHISHEPFVFPSQVLQVFYIQDPKVPKSYVALTMQPRDLFQLGDDSDDDDADVMNNFTATEFPTFDVNIFDYSSGPKWLRTDGEEGDIFDDIC